ncbi:FAD-binding protein [Paraburkholderia panacisoli]|nr:FAD-binding protein [Paraburkholderia panacisoli]
MHVATKRGIGQADDHAMGSSRQGVRCNAVAPGLFLTETVARTYSDSAVLDLKRMNRIFEVSDTNYYAIVEPGISDFDLYNYIRERGLKVWLDVPDPGWGSVVGRQFARS